MQAMVRSVRIWSEHLNMAGCCSTTSAWRWLFGGVWVGLDGLRFRSHLATPVRMSGNPKVQRRMRTFAHAAAGRYVARTFYVT